MPPADAGRCGVGRDSAKARVAHAAYPLLLLSSDLPGQACAAAALAPLPAHAGVRSMATARLADDDGGFTDETGQRVIGRAYQLAPTYDLSAAGLSSRVAFIISRRRLRRALISNRSPPDAPAIAATGLLSATACAAGQAATAATGLLSTTACTAGQVATAATGLLSATACAANPAATAATGLLSATDCAAGQAATAATGLLSATTRAAGAPPASCAACLLSATGARTTATGVRVRTANYASAQPHEVRGLLSALTGDRTGSVQGAAQIRNRRSHGSSSRPSVIRRRLTRPRHMATCRGPMADPRYDRQLVEYRGEAAPGTIIVDTPHFFLYLVLQGGKAIRYGIGVGRPGFTWAGGRKSRRCANGRTGARRRR